MLDGYNRDKPFLYIILGQTFVGFDHFVVPGILVDHTGQGHPESVFMETAFMGVNVVCE